jgi:hypothetical protein
MPAPVQIRLEKASIMRSDMHKVIVERPRRLGSTWKNRKTARRLSESERRQALENDEDYDSGPQRASSARHDKWLNENLAPLRRYLMRQLGRPWDKVYSEICRTIDTRSAIGLHVLQDIEQFITLDAFMEDGVVCERNWGYVRAVTGLYVHPVTGLIRLAKRRQSQRKRAEPTPVGISETLEYEKIDGLWFRMEYRMLEPDELVEHPKGCGPEARRVLIQKRQCDRKTIRQIEQDELRK